MLLTKLEQSCRLTPKTWWVQSELYIFYPVRKRLVSQSMLSSFLGWFSHVSQIPWRDASHFHVRSREIRVSPRVNPNECHWAGSPSGISILWGVGSIYPGGAMFWSIICVMCHVSCVLESCGSFIRTGENVSASR